MRLVVVSDVHYAGAAEQARRGWEQRVIPNGALRWMTGHYRRFLWLADPTAHNHQLDALIAAAGEPDLVVANGDYSCDSAFVGVSDAAAFASATECLNRLRAAFGAKLRATLGDHELGKMSLFGGVGGPRMASWEKATAGLGIAPFWAEERGGFWLVGITSTLVALPVFHPELLPAELAPWEELRAQHLDQIRKTFESLPSEARIILFCHDPTALPFLEREPAVRARQRQLVCTVIGHLHSERILRTSRRLAGMPALGFLGNTARRLSGALRRARAWKPFRVVLCPSPAGIQLFKDGGFLELQWTPIDGAQADAGAGIEIEIVRRRLPWR